jgi:tRNA-modifying protein YgfZ
MTDTKIALLDDRGIVRVTGEDATAFLDNLVTQDVTGMAEGEARFAALLTPQGKILFDFFVVRTDDGYLLDIARDKAADLAKRLTLYKLRAKVAIGEMTGNNAVIAAWGGQDKSPSLGSFYRDPRSKKLGERGTGIAPSPADAPESVASYHAHRIAHGIPEGGKDYPFGDTFPHEANMDRLNGVSFTKGCFVGQEVVARMQHKTVVRKRIITVTAASPLTSGATVTTGEATIGTIGSVAGASALAMLRLDRVVEAIAKGDAIMAGGVPLAVDAGELDVYRAETVHKAEKVIRI